MKLITLFKKAKRIFKTNNIISEEDKSFLEESSYDESLKELKDEIYNEEQIRDFLESIEVKINNKETLNENELKQIRVYS